MLSASEANRTYFRNAYQTGAHGWAVDAPSAYAIDFLKDVSRLIPGGRLLDIGCGEGRHSLAAAAMGFRVTAIDYEPLALRRARRFAKGKNINGVLFRNASVFKLPFRNSWFDVILDYGCLHHQRKSDWASYRAGILRVLKPTGFYILSVFSPRFRFFHQSTKQWHIARGAYRRCFTKKDFAELLGRNFEIVKIAEERGDNGGFWHLLMKRR
jgi:SAM-dependent methyltransferase